MARKWCIFLGIVTRKAASSSWLWGRAKEEDKRGREEDDGGRRKEK